MLTGPPVVIGVVVLPGNGYLGAALVVVLAGAIGVVVVVVSTGKVVGVSVVVVL